MLDADFAADDPLQWEEWHGIQDIAGGPMVFNPVSSCFFTLQLPDVPFSLHGAGADFKRPCIFQQIKTT